MLLFSMSWFVNRIKNIAKLETAKMKNVELMNAVVSLKDVSDF